MNILWDFRLFSFGYGARGVGVYTTAMAKAIRDAGCGDRITIWGQKERVPAEFHSWPVQWIEYTPRSWKSDLVVIPALCVRHRIDVFHYWIVLGPVFRVGMGLFHLCKTCVTVYDLGVEHWDDVPYCRATRQTWYWKTQKMLFPAADYVICDSHATAEDLKKQFPRRPGRTGVIYPPVLANARRHSGPRYRRFITLGGGAHKNVSAVIKSFGRFRETHPEFELFVLGEQDPGVVPLCGNEGVKAAGMDLYREYLASSSGLLLCSTHEGLGLPALEAMACGCPMVLSDIPVFHETCGDAGCYVDPSDTERIARGMDDLARNTDAWVERSRLGAQRYKEMSRNAGTAWIHLYKDLR